MKKFFLRNSNNHLNNPIILILLYYLLYLTAYFYPSFLSFGSTKISFFRRRLIIVQNIASSFRILCLPKAEIIEKFA